MKNVIAYSLLFVFSFAYSYEAIAFLTKKVSNGICAETQDVEGEEDTSEEGSDNEKKEFLDNFLFHGPHNFISTIQSNYKPIGDFIFSSADYSQTVYSPPECA